jgi:Zn-dependent protease with chaperone function
MLSTTQAFPENGLLIQQIIHDVTNIRFDKNILIEASPQRSSILMEIEKLFQEAKQSKDYRSILSDLEKLVTKFTGIKNVEIHIERVNEPNAGVLPIYNHILPQEFGLFDFIKKKKPTPHKGIQKLEETAEYVKGMHIFINSGLIKLLTPKEIVGVLMHEFGHVFYHTTVLPQVFSSLIGKVANIASLITVIRSRTENLPSEVVLPVLLTTATVSRTLTILDHKEELKGDEFAIKYGYGDELTSAISKLSSIKAPKTRIGKVFKMIISTIKNLLFASTHPSGHRRITKMADKIQKEYADLYPNYSRGMQKAMKDIEYGSVSSRMQSTVGG